MERARGDGRDPGRGDLRESLEERRGRVGGGFSARHRHGCRAGGRYGRRGDCRMATEGGGPGDCGKVGGGGWALQNVAGDRNSLTRGS